MRIGKFAEVNQVSIDTIRHYMEIGLIIPEMKGSHYYFDSRCQGDLNEILVLKGMSFSLSEIKTMLNFRRLGKLTLYQSEEYYKEIFNKKHGLIEREIQRLKEIKSNLEEEMLCLSKTKYSQNFAMGIDIRSLQLFKCLSCDGELVLLEGNVSNNQIMNGSLGCKCGEKYNIESGILMMTSSFEKSEVEVECDWIKDYISITDSLYLDNLSKGLEWYQKNIDFTGFHNKVVLEVGSGFGFSLRNIYDNLPDDCVYIAVDHDIKKHRLLKGMLEGAENKKNIIFVCADFLRIPIKDKSVDILLDFTGTSNYSFEHQAFLLRLIDRHIKEDAYLLGVFILFKNFGINTLIEEPYRRNFILKNVKDEIQGLHYNVIEESTSDFLDKGGKYESFFVEGEKIYFYRFYGKR